MFGLDAKLPSLPLLLTKAEALDFAANAMTQQAAALELSASVLASIKPEDLAASPELAKVVEHTKRSLVDPKLQADAMRSAAKAMRDLALEERIVAARTAAGAGIRP